MPDINAGTPDQSPRQKFALGSPGGGNNAPPRPLEERCRPVDWRQIFWGAISAGLPRVHLLDDPYLPYLDQATGGWRGLIERFYSPKQKFNGIQNANGAWVLTPQEEERKHAMDTANHLLVPPPDYFNGPSGRTYFCFLEMGYSPAPDWAIVHRRDGGIAIREDLLLRRPDSETTMETTVIGPLFQLHSSEIRLWEALAMHQHRAFLVEDHENEA